MSNIKRKTLKMNNVLAKHFSKLTSEDIPLLKYYFGLSRQTDSSLNLVNVIEWNALVSYYKCEHDGCLILLCHYNDCYYMSMPIGAKEKAIAEIKWVKELFEKAQETLYLANVTQEYLDALKLNFSPEIKEDRNNFDYIYELDSFRTFGGKKLQKKRNHLNKFYNLYASRYEFEMIDRHNFQELYPYVNNFKSEDMMLEYEKEGILEILDHFEELNVLGGLIKIDGQIEAYLLTSVLNDDTVQENVEKANHEFPGLPQALIKEFFSRNYLNYHYVNREEDMGHENLRQSKLSYFPTCFVEKYMIKL